MIHENISNKNGNKGKEIDIRACDCGSIHLSFFGRTTFHLSHQEFLDFSKGVVVVRSRLKQKGQEDRFDIRKMSGLNH